MKNRYRFVVIYNFDAAEVTKQSETEEEAYLNFKQQFKGVFERYGASKFAEIRLYYGQEQRLCWDYEKCINEFFELGPPELGSLSNFELKSEDKYFRFEIMLKTGEIIWTPAEKKLNDAKYLLKDYCCPDTGIIDINDIYATAILIDGKVFGKYCENQEILKLIDLPL